MAIFYGRPMVSAAHPTGKIRVVDNGSVTGDRSGNVTAVVKRDELRNRRRCAHGEVRFENSAAAMLVECLLDQELFEATVRRSPRGRRWIAVFTGPEPGQQVWRSTRLTDQAAALARARYWERQARRQRVASGGGIRKPTIRVRRGSAEAAAGLLTQAEVAAILGISVRTVREIERGAFEKLRRHPALRQFWREHWIGDVEENVGSHDPSGPEVAALFALARTPLEQRALHKVLGIILSDRLLRS